MSEEVSCRAYGFFVATFDAGIVREADLLRGLPLERARLRNPAARVSWEEWRVLCARFTSLVGDDAAIEAAGRVIVDSDVLGSLGRTLGLFADPRDLYKLAARWVLPALFRGLRFEFRDLSPGRMEIVAEIPATMGASEPWMRLLRGGLIASPRFIGQPDARVSGVVDERRSVWIVGIRAANGLRARIRRGLSAAWSVAPIFEELEFQQRQLDQSLEALRRVEHDLHTVLMALPAAVAIYRDGGQIVFSNRAFQEALGEARPGDFRLCDAVVPEDRERVHEAMRPRLGDESASFSFRLLRRPSGEVRVLEATAVHGISFQAAPASVLFAFDRTEQRRAAAAQAEISERLELAERMASLGTLAAGVTHEINNPLTYVLTNLDVAVDALRAGCADPSELRSPVESARDGAARIQRIVRELRAFSGARSGVGSDAADLGAVIESSLSLVMNEIRHRARLARAFGKLPTVRGDANRLVQLFVNLLANAAHAIPPGDVERHEIRVSAELVEGAVRISVTDTGVGIAPELLGRIFDPFFTTKSSSQGMGLGLAIAKRCVEEIGGRIDVRSVLDEGSTFAVTLPVATAPLVAPASGASAPAAPNARIRVLVVDDEREITRALGRALRDLEVAAVHSVDEALARLRDRLVVDVILCDVMMPGRTGADLYAALRRAPGGLERRIVFMTGGAFSDDAQAFLDGIENRCLAKPLDLGELRRVLAQVERANAPAAPADAVA